MEMLKLLMLIISLAPAHGLKESDIKLSIDYFNYRSVKIVCLLTCQQDNWALKFTRSAGRSHISVSGVFTVKPNIVNAVRSCLYQTFWHVGVVVDSHCPNFENLMHLASEDMYFSSSHIWMIINNTRDVIEIDQQSFNDTFLESYSEDRLENNTSAINILKNLNISVNTDILLATENNIDNLYDLYDIYNFGKIRGGNINVIPMGKWTEYTGLQVWLTGYKYQQRWDFKELPLKMIIVSTKPKLFRPELITCRAPTPDINIITKTSATIMDIVAEKHNIRFNYTVTDRWISTFSPNSTRVVANSLYFREQDLTPLLRISAELFTKIDFVHPPLTSIETKYYYRIPDYGVGKLENQFLTPLSAGSWICITGMSVLCGFVLVLAALLESRPSSAQYAIFTVIASICQQFFESNDDKEIRRISSARKVTILVTGMSCLLLYNYYTSSVVSWLLNGPPPSINSLEELLNSPLELIFEDVGYTRSWLQTPGYYFNKRNSKVEDELRAKKVFNKKKGARLLMTLDEGIELVKVGGYAFHTQVANANERISQLFNTMELCELGSLQSMENSVLYPSIPKKSPYKEFFVWSLARVKERGHISCVQRRLASQDISCDGSAPRALALGGAAPAFIMLAFGFVVAVGMLVCEIMIFTYRKNKQKKTAVVPFVN